MRNRHYTDKRPRDRHRPRCHYHRNGTAKTTYDTQEQAASVLWKYRLDGYTAYQCHTCHKWHIGCPENNRTRQNGHSPENP